MTTRGKRQAPAAGKRAAPKGGRRLAPSAPAGRARGRREVPPARRPFGAPDYCFLLAALVLAGTLLVTVVLPRALGLTAYAVTSVSMEPTLRRGDLLYTAPCTLEELREGDIVTYRAGDSVVTHRVYEVDAAAGLVRTRADSADHLDARPVTGEQLLGRAVYKLPVLGYLSLWRQGGAT